MLKRIYSKIAVVQINFFLYQIETGKDGMGSKQEREKERNGLREREMEHSGESEMAWIEKSDDWKMHLRI